MGKACWLGLLLWASPAFGYSPVQVLVLQWPETKVDHTHKGLQKKVQKQIGSTDTSFVWGVDLYQAGRVTEGSLAEQRATPSDDTISDAIALIEESSATPFDALSELEWSARAEELRQKALELQFVDQVALREPLFQLYTQIGRAAENSNQGAPPFYATVDDKSVNYYWFVAATLAHQDKTLLSKLLDKELHQNIINYKQQIDQGKYGAIPLSFDWGETIDEATFRAEYTVRIDGLDAEIPGGEGILEIPLGIHDIALVHKNGSYGLSMRIERQNRDRGAEHVLQSANKQIRYDLVEQLSAESAACKPKLSDDFAKYLSIYAQLHKKSATYVVVPMRGSASKKDVRIWRWNADALQLDGLGCE